MRIIGTLLAWGLLTGVGLHAQFTGGPASGYALADVGGISLSGEILTLNLLFRGGSADGYGLQQVVTTFRQPVAVFAGGPGDGYTQSVLGTTLNTELVALFAGGPADGYALGMADQVSLIMDLSVLFDGGIANGYGVGQSTAVTLQTDLQVLFLGGNDDGYTIANHNTTLTSESFMAPSPEALRFHLYPNPNTDRQLTLEIEGVGPGDEVVVLIYDAQGRLLYRQTAASGRQRLALSPAWAPGIYRVHVSDRNSQVTRNLLIVD